MAASIDGYNTTLRVIDFLEILPEYGDSVVLIVMHPGLNLLDRYLPSAKVNDLLLADSTRLAQSPAQSDVLMRNSDDVEVTEGVDASDTMDLASFLE